MLIMYRFNLIRLTDNRVQFRRGSIDNVDVSTKQQAVKQVTDAAKDLSKKDAKIVAYNSKTSQLNTIVT